jgi:hypothetical protein
MDRDGMEVISGFMVSSAGAAARMINAQHRAAKETKIFFICVMF